MFKRIVQKEISEVLYAKAVENSKSKRLIYLAKNLPIGSLLIFKCVKDGKEMRVPYLVFCITEKIPDSSLNSYGVRVK